MTLYCNDCGEGFIPPGDPDLYQMTSSCICPSCLHEAGDCIRSYNACEFCRAKHKDHDEKVFYCWFCQHKEDYESS